MDHQEATKTSLETRVKSINDATNGLFEAIVKAVSKAGEGSQELDAILTHSLTLANCGLIALTEIADAQQRVARVVELDATTQINERAEILATTMAEDATKRSFIGRKPK